MPRDDIRPHLRNIRFRDLGPLKPIWRVSLAALIYRAHDLDLITDRHKRTLYMDLGQLPGGRKREPGEFEAEQPRLLRYLIDHYQGDLNYSNEDICELLSVTEDILLERHFQQPSRRLRAVSSEQPRHVVRMPTRV